MTKEPPRPPAVLVGSLLRQAHQALWRRVLEHIRKAGFEDIGLSLLAVFQHPSPEGQSPIEVARRLGISKQALNYLLRQLEERGYLERRQGVDANRGRRVRLTPRGRALSAEARAAVLAVERDWAQRLGPEQYRVFREALTELAQGLEQSKES